MALRMHRVYAAGAAGLLVLALMGCGSDDDSTVAQPSAAPTSAAPMTDPVADEAEVRAAYEGFFDGSKPPETKLALLERSSELGEALALAGKDPNATKASAKVQGVAFISPTEATVTYDILSSGQVVLPGAMGKAVKEDGAWKVSAQTFCQLTALSAGQTTIAGCT